MRTLKILFALASMFLYSVFTNAQTSKNDAILGKWHGDMVINDNFKLKVAFEFSKIGTNEYDAVMHVVDQNSFNIEIETIQIKADSIYLTINSLRSTYKGQLVNERSIIGNIVQGKGKPFTLNLSKTNEFPFQISKRPQEPKKPYPYISENLTFENVKANVKLSGTFTRPFGSGKYPTVVLISGSGPNDRNQNILGHKTFLVLADYLTRNGIAVLRYDDRGAGESTGSFRTATMYDHATDASSALDYLATRSDVDIKQLGVIGHSLGADMAPMVANMNSNAKYILLLAGSPIPLKDGIIEQCNAIFRTMDISTEGIALNQQILMSTFEIFKNSPNDSIAKAEIKKSFEKFNPLVKAMNPSDREKLELSAPLKLSDYSKLLLPFMRHDLFYNPSDDLVKVKCPVFAINGDKDLQVLPHNLTKIEQALRNGGNKDITIKLYPGKNHLFQSCTKATIDECRELEETMSPEVQKDIANWILTRKL